MTPTSTPFALELAPEEPGLVSVIIPTYNRAALLRVAIDSVLAQTYTQVEILVVDDGSSDDTRDVVNGYGAPVRYLFQQNSGVSAARNLGFRHARGEFVALLDSDDSWLPWKLEAQIRLLRQHPQVGMVWTDMIAVREDGTVIDPKYLRVYYDAHAQARIEDVCQAHPLSNAWPDAPAPIASAPFSWGDIFSQMLLGNLVHTSTVLVRRERLLQVGEFDTGLTHSGEDYEFHLRTCSYGPVGLLDASSIFYRVGAADQLTAPHLGIHRAQNNLTTVLRWLERGGDRITLPKRMVRERLAFAYAWVGEMEMEYGNWGHARSCLWRSICYRPAQRRTVLLLMLSLLTPAVFQAARTVKRWFRPVLKPAPGYDTRGR